MRALLGLLCGLVFGAGLLVSGVADPAEVLTFLDVFGAWDPSLAFVMAGATLTAFVGYRFAWRRRRPFLMAGFGIPARCDIDGRLLAGAAIFGVGWGNGGFCPGPAWTALPLAAPGTLVLLPAKLNRIATGSLLRSSPLRIGRA